MNQLTSAVFVFSLATGGSAGAATYNEAISGDLLGSGSVTTQSFALDDGLNTLTGTWSVNAATDVYDTSDYFNLGSQNATLNSITVDFSVVSVAGAVRDIDSRIENPVGPLSQLVVATYEDALGDVSGPSQTYYSGPGIDLGNYGNFFVRVGSDGWGGSALDPSIFSIAWTVEIDATVAETDIGIVPLPASGMLLLVGLGGLASLRRALGRGEGSKL